METLKELISSLSERLKNPLINSFIISWLIYNWRVPIALLFYDNEDIRCDGFYSFNSFIGYEISKVGTFCVPFLCSVSYILVFPFLRNWMSELNAWFISWGSERTLKRSKEGFISTDKYMTLRETLKIKEDNLAKIIKEESKYLEEIQELKISNERLATDNLAINSIENERRNVQQELDKVNDAFQKVKDELFDKQTKLNLFNERFNYSDIKFLKGNWKLSIKDRENSNLIININIEKNNFKIEPLNGSNRWYGLMPKEMLEFIIQEFFVNAHKDEDFQSFTGLLLVERTLTKQDGTKQKSLKKFFINTLSFNKSRNEISFTELYGFDEELCEVVFRKV